MGRFNQIKQSQNKLKNLIIERILTNQDLLKYIYYNSSDPLSEIDIDDTTSLLNTHIFKKGKIIDVSTKAQTFLIIRTKGNVSREKITFKDIRLVFDVICHNSIIENLDNGFDRALCILDELDDIFNGSRGQWIGKMEYGGYDEIFLNDNYSGYRAIYNCTDFN